MKYIVLLGRILYSMIFMLASLGHFTGKTIAYAAAQGVPFAQFVVPLSGVMALLGGLSIALGYKTKYGALLLVLFLVPVTVMLHKFWTVTDPIMAQMQLAMFMKNTALIGGAFMIMHFGTGPLSLDARPTASRLR
ncbi:MAG: DoxX family protein [Bacteroidota bacterium]